MSSNFLQWNPGAANQDSDAEYAADSQRNNGAIDGQLFDDKTANKLFYQTSTFISALAAAMSSKGYNLSDASVSTLQNVLANLLTNADLKSNQIAVPFSPSPVFDCSKANGFRIDLSGNVTNPSVIGQTAGQIVTFFIVSQSPGNYSFIWPSNVVDPPNIQTQNEGNLNTFQFISDGTRLYPLSNFMTYLNGRLNTTDGNVTTAQTTANTALGNANSALAQIAALVNGGVLAVPGAISFPVGTNKLTLQWNIGATVNSSATVTQTVNFQRAFGGACLVVFVTDLFSSGADDDIMGWQAVSWNSNSVFCRRARRGDEGNYASAPIILAIGIN